MSSSRGPQTRRAAPLIVAAATAFALLVAMVVLLAMTLAERRASREHIEATDAKLTALTAVATPAAEQVTPLARDARPLVRSAKPVVDLLAAAAPSLRSAGAILGPTLPRLSAFVGSGQELVAEAVPVLRMIAGSGLAPTLAQARQVLGGVPVDKLDSALARASVLLDDAATTQLPARVAETADLLEQVLAVQHELVALQKHSVRVQTRSLNVQLRTLSHTRSIDNRLGGQLPSPLGN
jgi:hypothetical protein